MLKADAENEGGLGTFNIFDSDDSDDSDEESESEGVAEEDDDDESSDSDASTEEEEEEEKKKPADWMIKEQLSKHNSKPKKEKLLMIVSVLQQGQEFTFEAYDPHPLRRGPPIRYTWCDQTSAALAHDMMSAEPDARIAMLEVNLDMLQLLRHNDGTLHLDFLGASKLSVARTFQA